MGYPILFHGQLSDSLCLVFQELGGAVVVLSLGFLMENFLLLCYRSGKLTHPAPHIRKSIDYPWVLQLWLEGLPPFLEVMALEGSWAPPTLCMPSSSAVGICSDPHLPPSGLLRLTHRSRWSSLLLTRHARHLESILILHLLVSVRMQCIQWPRQHMLITLTL